MQRAFLGALAAGGNGCLSLHVRLGGDPGLDGKINGIGYQFQLPVGHGLSLHADHPAVFAVILFPD